MALRINKGPDGVTRVTVDGVSALEISATGVVTYPQNKQPVCSTVFTGTTAPAGQQTPLTTNAKLFDSDNFITAGGQFKPTLAGYYQLNATVSSGAASVTGLGCTLRRTGGSGNHTVGSSLGISSATPWGSQAVSALIYMNGVDDTVTVDAYSAAGAFTGTGTFSAALIKAA